MSTLDLSPDLQARLTDIERAVRRELRQKRIGYRGVQSLLDGLNAGLEKHSFGKLVGRGSRAYNNRTTAEKLWLFLEGKHAIPRAVRSEINTEFDKWLENQRRSPLWRDALSDLKNELEYGDLPGEAGREAIRVDDSLGGTGSSRAIAYSTGSEPDDAPTGRSTGSRRNRISELCHAEAEWRDSNLGPGETRWLQLLVRIKQSYTRSRGGGDSVELSIHVHRIHVNAALDGALAASRGPWVENAVSGSDRIEVFEGNSWTPERPCYEVDNPVRSSPLTGHFNWFDLCEVSGAVGQKALLEVSVSIGGISIELPKSIREQLDPDPKHQYDTPEIHLIEGWLRHRLVPRSRLSGGLYQLTQIDLQKVRHE